MKLHIAILNHEDDRFKDAFVIIAHSHLELRRRMMGMLMDFFSEDPETRDMLKGMNTRNVEEYLDKFAYLVSTCHYNL